MSWRRDAATSRDGCRSWSAYHSNHFGIKQFKQQTRLQTGLISYARLAWARAQSVQRLRHQFFQYFLMLQAKAAGYNHTHSRVTAASRTSARCLRTANAGFQLRQIQSLTYLPEEARWMIRPIRSSGYLRTPRLLHAARLRPSKHFLGNMFYLAAACFDFLTAPK